MINRQADFSRKWAKMIAKAWSDPTFKKKLLEHPEKTFAEEGISLPKGVRVEIHESTNKIIHLNLPSKAEGNLSEEKLLQIAMGQTNPGSNTPTEGRIS